MLKKNNNKQTNQNNNKIKHQEESGREREVCEISLT